MGLLRRLTLLGLSAAALCAGFVGATPQRALAAPAPPKSLRLYVFDCGLINVNRAGTGRYNVTPEEVGETRFVVPCFLIAHPRGTLMWDLGVVPDDTVEARARGEQGMEQSAASRATIEEYLKRTKTEIWIEHDFMANAKLKKAPAYYE
jgi:hypothetical protein